MATRPSSTFLPTSPWVLGAFSQVISKPSLLQAEQVPLGQHLLAGQPLQPMLSLRAWGLCCTCYVLLLSFCPKMHTEISVCSMTQQYFSFPKILVCITALVITSNFRNPAFCTFTTGPKDQQKLRNSVWIQKIFIMYFSLCFSGLKMLHQQTFPSFAFTEMESCHARTQHMDMEQKSMHALFRRLARIQSMVKSHKRAVQLNLKENFPWLKYPIST